MDRKNEDALNSIAGELRAAQKFFKPTTIENHAFLTKRYFEMFNDELKRYGPHSIMTHMAAMRCAAMLARFMVDFPSFAASGHD